MTNDDNENDVIRNFKSNFDSIKNTDSDKCPPSEILIGYHNKSLSKREKAKFEEHLAYCPLCLEALENLSESEGREREEFANNINWPAIEEEIDSGFYTKLENMFSTRRQEGYIAYKKEKWAQLKKWLGIFNVIRQNKLVYAGAFTGLIVLVIYSCAYFSRDKYFALASIEPERTVNMRAESMHSALTEALNYYSQNNYNDAIIQISKYLETNPDDYHAHYYLGLCYLSLAEVRLLGLAYKYDNSAAEKAITNLSRALQLSNSNFFYREDCYWYLGKAYLMKGDITSSKHQFVNILKLNQPNLFRKDEAQKMLNSLD